MEPYQTLKDAITNTIKENGGGEITGDLLQQVLLAIVRGLGIGEQFMGIATPATNPGTIDYPCFYIAFTAGAYPNFGGISLRVGDYRILANDANGGGWRSLYLGNSLTGHVMLNYGVPFSTSAQGEAMAALSDYAGNPRVTSISYWYSGTARGVGNGEIRQVIYLTSSNTYENVQILSLGGRTYKRVISLGAWNSTTERFPITEVGAWAQQ